MVKTVNPSGIKVMMPAVISISLCIVTASEQVNCYDTIPDALNATQKIGVQFPFHFRPRMTGQAVGFGIVDAPKMAIG